MAFGSCVTGDFAEKTSDINLMIVYSDLNLVSLNDVAAIAKRWLEKRNFAPRFLSRRNLLSSARYFQIDLLEMKDAHVVLHGEDLLAGLPTWPADLHWQLAHEIKAMRMRIKQQFWRTSGDERRIRFVLLERFSSLVHLIRALLFLLKKPTPVEHARIMELACAELGVDARFVARMFQFKAGQIQLNREEMVQTFADLMEVIRLVDGKVDEVKL
jgi:hypothetical protein